MLYGTKKIKTEHNLRETEGLEEVKSHHSSKAQNSVSTIIKNTFLRKQVLYRQSSKPTRTFLISVQSNNLAVIYSSLLQLNFKLLLQNSLLKHFFGMFQSSFLAINGIACPARAMIIHKQLEYKNSENVILGVFQIVETTLNRAEKMFDYPYKITEKRFSLESETRILDLEYISVINFTFSASGLESFFYY